MRSPTARLAAVAVALAVALGWLVTTGWGIEPGALRSWAAFERWYLSADPAVAAMVVARLVTTALTAWLLSSALLQLLARISGIASLRLTADLISPRSLQRLGHGLAGLSLTAGLSLPVPSVGTPPPTAPVTTVQEPGTASLRPLEEIAPLAPAPGEVEVVGEPPSAVSDQPRVVRVQAGDSFWSIAEVTAGGDDANVARYWRRLVEVNRDRLVDPGNADLIYPGQELLLPL